MARVCHTTQSPPERRILLDGVRSFLHIKFMTETQQLIARIHALAAKLERSPATISAKVLGGGKVLSELERGRTITLAKYEKAKAALSVMEQAA